mmetsp:Transcript_53719/g.165280  ORF Transcript_53719/g.165280 Transcript_53719/m.165280 type:complete len:447 (-) Transcript_53719:150-1490(-)
MHLEARAADHVLSDVAALGARSVDVNGHVVTQHDLLAVGAVRDRVHREPPRRVGAVGRLRRRGLLCVGVEPRRAAVTLLEVRHRHRGGLDVPGSVPAAAEVPRDVERARAVGGHWQREVRFLVVAEEAEDNLRRRGTLRSGEVRLGRDGNGLCVCVARLFRQRRGVVVGGVPGHQTRTVEQCLWAVPVGRVDAAGAHGGGGAVVPDGDAPREAERPHVDTKVLHHEREELVHRRVHAHVGDAVERRPLEVHDDDLAALVLRVLRHVARGAHREARPEAHVQVRTLAVREAVAEDAVRQVLPEVDDRVAQVAVAAVRNALATGEVVAARGVHAVVTEVALPAHVALLGVAVAVELADGVGGDAGLAVEAVYVLGDDVVEHPLFHQGDHGHVAVRRDGGRHRDALRTAAGRLAVAALGRASPHAVGAAVVGDAGAGADAGAGEEDGVL